MNGLCSFEINRSIFAENLPATLAPLALPNLLCNNTKHIPFKSDLKVNLLFRKSWGCTEYLLVRNCSFPVPSIANKVGSQSNIKNLFPS